MAKKAGKEKGASKLNQPTKGSRELNAHVVPKGKGATKSR